MLEIYATCPASVNAAYFAGLGSDYADDVANPSKHTQLEKSALGRRLASARELSGMNQADAAYAIGITKAALSAWETGRNIPDALMVRRLAKAYRQAADALLWDNPVTNRAMQVAASYDGLTPAQQGRFETLWSAFFAEAITDAEVEQRIPLTQTLKPVEPERKPGHARAVATGPGFKRAKSNQQKTG